MKNFFFIFNLILILISISSFFFPSQAWTLAIDEKLPLRILKTSDTKKTVLINRGVEDGLVVGDHAKFFLTTGVVARGVVVQTSPSRSVWAMYRLTNASDIAEDKVMNLKIATAVKLSQDVTKMFVDDEKNIQTPEGITLAEGAQDLDQTLSDEENKELSKLSSNTSNNQSSNETSSVLSHKTLELWGMFHLTSLTSTNSTGTEGEGTSGSVKTFDAFVGLEKYFLNYYKWYGSFSLYPFIHYAKQDSTSVLGHTVSSSVFAYGGGLNWHFLAPPMSIDRVIGFLGFSAGVGSATDSSVLQDSPNSADTSVTGELTGKVSFYSLGAGIKYFLGWGLGFKVTIDYYHRAETYAMELSEDNYTKVVAGPRVLLGLSYRF